MWDRGMDEGQRDGCGTEGWMKDRGMDVGQRDG